MGAKPILPSATTDRLVINLPASVQYQPGDKAEAIVSGNPTLLGHVRLQNGKLSLNCDPSWVESRLDVSLSGPAIEQRWVPLDAFRLSRPKAEPDYPNSQIS